MVFQVKIVKQSYRKDTINHLLDGSIEKIKSIVQLIQNSSSVSERVVDESIKIFSEIKELNSKSTLAILQITESSKETMENIDDSVRSIKEINKMINFNKKMTDETNAQIGIIKDQSYEVQSVIQNLEEIVNNSRNI